MDNQVLIGERIKKAREKAGLTQSQLGEMLGYSAMGISYLEKGLRKIKIEHLEKIAEKLKVNISYFLEPVSPAPYPNTTYGRIDSDLTDDQKREVKNKILEFDKHVEGLLKNKK